MYRMLYSFLQEFHLLTKLGVEQRSQCWHMFSFLKPGVGQNVAMHALPTVINVCSNFYLPSLFTSIFFPKPSPYIFYCISFGECSNCLRWLAETNNSSCLASQLTDAGSGGRGSKTYCNSESDVCLWFDRLFLPLLNPHSVCILCRVNIEIHVHVFDLLAFAVDTGTVSTNFDLWFSDLHFELVKKKQRDMNVWLVVKWPNAVDRVLTIGELTNLSFSFLCSPGGQEVSGSDSSVGGTQPLCRAGQDAHGMCTDANTSNGKKNAIYYDKIPCVNVWGKNTPFFNNSVLLNRLDLVLEC